jgi:hypothetical protein
MDGKEGGAREWGERPSTWPLELASLDSSSTLAAPLFFSPGAFRGRGCGGSSPHLRSSLAVVELPVSQQTERLPGPYQAGVGGSGGHQVGREG